VVGSKVSRLARLATSKPLNEPVFFGIFFPPENKIKKTNAMKVFSNQNILGYQ